MQVILDRVAAGESITITVGGRGVAVLAPAGRRPRFMPRQEFLASVLSHQADEALRADLSALAPDMSDEITLG